VGDYGRIVKTQYPEKIENAALPSVQLDSLAARAADVHLQNVRQPPIVVT
jgi:hypothetical protein